MCIRDSKDLDYAGRRNTVRTIAKSLNVSTGEVTERVSAMCEEVEKLQQQLEALGSAEQVDASSLLESAEDQNGIGFVARELPMSNPNLMRQLIDQCRKKQSPIAVFLATAQGDDKVILVAGVSNDLVKKGVKAGDWVKEIAPIVGGGGGGKPDMAQAGGKDPSKISEALEKAKEFIAAKSGA